jgi:LTXXQ motif family protein
LRSNAVRHALNSRSVAGALRNRGALHNPGIRAQIAANAATAGWRNGGGGRNGWWRHGNGGYGWVGPLFWPFAYYDMYDYAMWGDGGDPAFWGYGYNDIYAGLFAPYGYDDLTGYLPSGGGPARQRQASSATAANPAPDQLSQMCGEDSRDIAGLPIDQIQGAIQPNEAQRAALDDLANASVKAAQDIKTACPTQIALTAPSRLAAMQARIEAMIAATGAVQPPLENFYGLLNDEQKARLNALGQNQARDRRSNAPAQNAQNANGSTAQSCVATQPGVTDWPAAEIEATLHPTEAQRAALAALQDASAKAADMLKSSCGADQALTPPARLTAIGRRLDVMLQAVKTVRASLDDFYGKLTDEQKAQFEAIGPRHAGTADEPAIAEPATTQTRGRRHHASVGGIIRRLISIAR